ncbi:MAG TPA: LysM peptidoglycan-binding domain-containing protein [Anaeromyxobacter sp.]
MRPNRTTLPVLTALLLAVPARAQAPATAAAAVTATTHALPPADPPAAKLVPAAPASGPVPTVARLLADEELLAASPDVPDDPAVAEEIDSESAELEDLRRAEEESHVQDHGPGIAPHKGGEGRIALLPELDHDLAQLRAEYDIPIDVNEAVVGYVRFFQSRAARAHFVKWLGRSHRYMEKYRAILKQEGLPEDTVFLAMIESGFGNFAYSRARASGPWQFIGPTGKLFGLKQDFWVDERRDPEKSAHAAARYLKLLRQQTGDWRLAWAGYNAGVGRVFKAKAKGYDDFWEMAAVPGRKVLRAETKGYVPKLMAAAIVTKHPDAFGFRAEEIDPQRWEEYAEVTIPSAALLGVVARAAGVTERALMDLNPELRRACTPPRAYQLKIPKGQEATFAQAWPAIQGKVRMTFAGHVVRRGDTISSVAHHYGVPAEGIMEMNGLRTAKKLRVGQELIIPKPMGGGQLAAAAEPPPQARSRSPKARQGQVADEQPRREPAATQVAAAERVERAPRSTLRVQAGDTLWSISRRLGVELQQLCRWNGIDNPRRHKLLVGAQLVVFGQRG